MDRFARLAAPVLALILACVSAPVIASGPLSAEKTAEIHDYVTSVLAELNVPGAAVVIVGAEGPVFAEGFGRADDSGRSATPQTPFRIASLSKQLTGIAVMQLVQSGKLSLSAPVHDYLPWFGANGSPTVGITIADLLAHTSGWSVIPEAGTESDDGAMERYVRGLADTPRSHPIGQFEYSDGNYNVLGYLVGVVSGTSYEAYMQEHVLNPLRMSNTYLSQAAARAGGVAQGHLLFFGVPIGWEISYSRASLPAASIVASAEDLGHVLTAHLNNGAYGDAQVLSASAMALLHRPLTHPDTWDGYGWGWWSYPLWDAGSLADGTGVSQYEVPIILEHRGSVGTFATDMVLMPEAGYGIVVLMNLNDEVAPSRFYLMQLGIADILSGKPAPALTSNDEPLHAFARPMAAALPLLQLVGIGIAVRRIRRWRRDPPSGARRGGWRIRHLVLPLALDLGVPIVLWWLFFLNVQLSPLDLMRVFASTPDLWLALLLVALLGVGWGLLRTALTLRVMRAAAS